MYSSVVDLPGSFEGALARNSGVFGDLSNANSWCLEAFRKVFRPTILDGGIINRTNVLKSSHTVKLAGGLYGSRKWWCMYGFSCGRRLPLAAQIKPSRWSIMTAKQLGELRARFFSLLVPLLKDTGQIECVLGLGGGCHLRWPLAERGGADFRRQLLLLTSRITTAQNVEIGLPSD
jgi:hypothetical protein